MRKAIYIFLLLILTVSLVNAQQRNAVSSDRQFDRSVGTESNDTLHYMVPPGVIYTATISGQPAGYVNGTNDYFDTGKYQRFDFAMNNPMAHSLILFFGAKQVVGSSDTVFIVIRQVATNGAPGDLIVSIPKLVSEIDTTGPTVVSLAKESIGDIELDGMSVFVGIEWSLTVDDKFALISNQSPNGASPSRVWERWNDGTFWQYGSPSSWALQIDLWIGVVYANMLTGDYYIPQGTHPKGFASFDEAMETLNSTGAVGITNFLLDADTLRGAAVEFNPPLWQDAFVTIKPAPGRNVTLLLTSNPSVGNGPYLIGFKTGNITFDGSNNGTDTRNLVISTEQITPVVDVPFTLNHADADSVTLKNLVIKNYMTGQTNFRYGAVINDLGGVTGFRVENCQIGTPERPVRRDALAPWGGASVANSFSILNNEMYCGTRGVATIYLTNSEIIGNTIHVLPTSAGATDTYNHGIYITGHVGNLNIEGNVINCLEKTLNASAYLIGIAFAGNGAEPTDIISVVNNMINIGAADETRYTYGIGFRSAQNMGNIKAYYNTIVVNNNASTLVSHAIGYHTNGTGPVNVDLKNNIIINKHTGNTGSSAIALVPATTVLTSNYNVLKSEQNLVNYQGTSYADLPAWQVTTQDANSVSKPVFFVSGTDLHLVGSSSGDIDLAGTPIAGITTDIDGDLRDAVQPYKGADESTPFVTPVFYADNFDLPDGTLLSNSGWTAHSGAGTNSIAVNPPALGFPGYLGGGEGNSVGLLGPSGEDVHRNFAEQTTGSFYTSFLVNVTAATEAGDYFVHLGPTTISTTFRGRVYVKRNAENLLAFGVSKGGNDIVYTPFNYTMNTTTLVVLKYQFVAGESTDIVKLWVNPVGGTEPAALLEQTDATTDPVNLGSVAFRQGGASTAATLRLDGLRIGSDWLLVVGNPELVPVELSLFEASVTGSSVSLNWVTATETNNSGFEVERNINGSWAKIGFVSGKGTTSEISSYQFTDNLTGLTLKGELSYRLKQVDFDGTFAYSQEVKVEFSSIVSDFALEQNYPNPFNPVTKITYQIPVDARVELSVYSISGELVTNLLNEFQQTGKYTVSFDGSNLASGVYFYKLNAGDFIQIKKLVLMK